MVKKLIVYFCFQCFCIRIRTMGERGSKGVRRGRQKYPRDNPYICISHSKILARTKAERLRRQSHRDLEKNLI